jgi:hypothetical protein
MKNEIIAPEDLADHEIGLEMIRVLKLRRKRDNGRVETTHGDKNPCGLARTVRDLDPGHAAMLAALQAALACLENLREVQQWDKADGDHIDEAIDARDAVHLAIRKATKP